MSKVEIKELETRGIIVEFRRFPDEEQNKKAEVHTMRRRARQKMMIVGDHETGTASRRNAIELYATELLYG